MSGMAKGVLVVEAGETSGALNTASRAIEQGREVFAMPTISSTKTGIGCNKLIQDGAKLVRGIEDIIDEIPSHSPNALLLHLLLAIRLTWTYPKLNNRFSTCWEQIPFMWMILHAHHSYPFLT
jgi:predicted Rossmann fold nucleotide-binding protein DprA/Smf involved in DNA uptake